MEYKTNLLRGFAVLGLMTWSVPLSAHEFWIETNESRAVSGTSISADIRVGQDLFGVALVYLDTIVKSMAHHAPDKSSPLAGRLGDQPAIDDVVMRNDGLHIITVETHPAYIVFETMGAFEDYLDYEGLDDVAATHVQRSLPDIQIGEEYIRNARALVQIGAPDEGDIDRATGMPFEIIVQGTPFSIDRRELKVRLEWHGAALPDTQISLFHLPSGGSPPDDTSRTLAQTDHDGYVTFSMFGAGKYLLNAVRMDPVDNLQDVTWRSHWASLTFELQLSP